MISKEPKDMILCEIFHLDSHIPVEEHPTIPSPDIIKCRINLLTEELKELEQAFEKGDLVSVADALGDLQIALSGTVLVTGMGSIFDRIIKEIHLSNMSKKCYSREEASATRQKYLDKGEDPEIFEVKDHYIVQVNGKICKPDDFENPELGPIIEEALNAQNQ